MRRIIIFILSVSLFTRILPGCTSGPENGLKDGFLNPPDDARPGVYWYFMDGNLSREGMTADLEAMKEAGIGNVLFLEVNVGIPRGKVDFLSDEWQNLYMHAVREAERLGIEITLGSGPGWAGSGGPWVKPEQSMLHLMSSSAIVTGPGKYEGILPVPPPYKPYFGEGALTPSLKKTRDAYYEDVFVLAFPVPDEENRIKDADEKALYFRDPYTSVIGVKPFLPALAQYDEVPGAAVDPEKIIDLTSFMKPDGSLGWIIPTGKWKIMRFGKRNNGAVTRPAPEPGLGFEADKFDTTAFNAHFDEYIGRLVRKVGPRREGAAGGWTMLHIDSWEMSSQNWSKNFREEFNRRRGYDLFPFLPVYSGQIVGSLELSERFLWDLRLTSMELILENHAEHFKELGRRNGFTLSIEPYDMNPASDFDLGAVADIPMCEFWTKGLGFNSAFSCIEASSIAHIYGRSIVAAEAFTSYPKPWVMYPGNMKNQGDWAFCMGINKFVYHTFAHQPFPDELRPGMTMGPYGIHHDRGQTWWPMASDYHRYISRCQYILRQGRTIADILYLIPEGAPNVFKPPASAMEGDEVLPDKRGYNFDGCSPLALMKLADVKDHRIVFPGGASYSLMVLPAFNTMTPELLDKIESLIKKGAIVIGNPPFKSPGLSNYPACDQKVSSVAETVWGRHDIPGEETTRDYGLGKVYWGGNLSELDSGEIYPSYEVTNRILGTLGVKEDFISSGSIRYTHRTTAEFEIYFISNRTGLTVADTCIFHAGFGLPELWDPVTGEIRTLPDFQRRDGETAIPLKLDKYQSFFIVFPKNGKAENAGYSGKNNFPEIAGREEIPGPWNVSFSAEWGGPENIVFEKLDDWSARPEEGIKFYSGTAVYHKTFDLPGSIFPDDNSDIYLDLGEVRNLARVKLNGIDLGVIWTSPWRVKITDAVRESGNELEVEIGNLWVNRLIGDADQPWDGIENNKWPIWLLEGTPRTSGRYTFTTNNFYKEDMPLEPSGLLGPARIYRIHRND